MPLRHRIGRRDPSAPIGYRFAFYVERADDAAGGIKITDIQPSGLTDSERETLFAHFGQPMTARTGGTKQTPDGPIHYTRMTTEPPGSVVHFERACDMLPEPFTVIAERY